MESRKIMVIKPSKFERSEALRKNKKYWQNILRKLDEKDSGSRYTRDIKYISKDLSNNTCEKVCEILQYELPTQISEITIKTKNDYETNKVRKEPLISYRKSIFIEREEESDTDVECCSSEDEEGKVNVHQDFLSKPEREQITWNTRFLQPEREDEKSLVKKSNDITERIAQNFCEYMKDLGGDQQSQLFTAKAIKELFQVEFDTHVSRSLRVIPKELPTVNDNIANVTGNVELSRNAALVRQISKDISAESQIDNVKAFGRSLPRHEQWRSPGNHTKSQWRSARHVPKDLVSLKTVWEGITNIRSVREYCRWMIQHPEHKRPPYLNSLGMFNPMVLNARLTMELQQGVTPPLPSFDNTPAPIEQLRRRLSQLAE